MFFVVFCLSLLTFMVGCGNSSSRSTDDAVGVSDVSAEGMAAEETDAAAKDGVDVDLAALSEPMAYSEVFDMINNPDTYLGLTVRMEGTYSHVRDEALDKDYFSCSVLDAGACCSQFLDFEPVNDYVWPDDFPLDGDTIRVQGVFDSYEVGENTYYILRDAIFYAF